MWSLALFVGYILVS